MTQTTGHSCIFSFLSVSKNKQQMFQAFLDDRIDAQFRAEQRLGLILALSRMNKYCSLPGDELFLDEGMSS